MFLLLSGLALLESRFLFKPLASSVRGVSSDAIATSDIAADMGVLDLDTPLPALESSSWKQTHEALAV